VATEQQPSASPSRAALARFSFAWWLTGAAFAYLAAVTLAWLLVRFASDVWWPASLLLFGPIWLFGTPLLVLVPAALVSRRRLLLPLGVAAVVFAWPLMSFTVSSRGLARAVGGASAPAGSLRVMTLNVGGGSKDPAELGRVISEIDPHVAVFQECIDALDEKSLREKGYVVELGPGMCLVSKLPLRSVDMIERSGLEDRTGAGKVMMYTFDFDGRDICVFNLHLETIREGIEGLRSRKLSGGSAMEANIGTRNRESERARGHADKQTVPLILAGDFNMPVESAIYRRWWSGFENAFSQAGLGYGRTKTTRFFGTRIDHVLVGADWQVESVRVGARLGHGQDHQPVIAELTLKEKGS